MSDSSAGTTTPWRSDPAVLQVRLAEWARSMRGDRAVVADVDAPSSGMQNDTVLFTLDGERLVARLAPSPDSVFPTFRRYDLELQGRVMQLVWARTTVPVPEVVHLEQSPEWFGVPFLVMRAVEGSVASDNPPYLMDPGGWFLQGTPEQQQRFEESTIDVLVRLHQIRDDDQTAFLRLDEPGETRLAQQVSDLRAWYEWGRGEHRVPIIERALDAITETMPPNGRAVLNWGDSRPGNILYRDFEPSAILDWEMATVGPPEVDVAWATFFHKFFAGMAEPYGMSVPVMFDPAATAATYERLGGHPLDDLAWYEALAGCRFAIILLRMTQRSAAFGLQPLPDDPNDMVLFGPLLDRLVEGIGHE
jgi:aminoglycoside phosphotransferase (APT) family kinase protein